MRGMDRYVHIRYSPRMRAPRETIELFHLHFLRQLAAGRDKGNYVVKGGCNLRFFFGSVRYSEDLDLDVEGTSIDALQDRVDGILGSRTLRESLASVGVEVRQTTAPKQMSTTQRWKAQLLPAGSDLPLHTKIEFSRRGGEDASALEAVDRRLVRRYRLMPLLVCHYLLPAAIRQKVRALMDRREVQARDVFDLSLLFASAGDDLPDLGDLASRVPEAVARVLDLSYADCQGQVIAYLEPEHAESVGSSEAWEELQLHVISALEHLGGNA